MEKFVCVHGHFYQPPRENPWLETVELQDSAAPYHDWNERITVECYAPNATARIMDGQGRIDQIISNYSRISFNFGPTLLAWLKDKMPEIHDAIVTADKLSRERFSGHGSALAQTYNHMILPLANARDKHTQVLWGIRDFESRFGRAPEGMWLAETAADTESFEILAKLGIRFTILSPYQASRVKGFGKRNSRDVNGGQIDPTRPYQVQLPSGKTMCVFFYDAPVSQAVAFERLLISGERLAHRLMSAFDEHRERDQLVHIATDGESYGHHHRHGEMALAYALNYIENEKLARLTNYGEFLEKHPPAHQVFIHEKSAWSCSHGVGRWMSDCGCNSGGHGGWSQAWRAPLRHALDWLRDQLAPMYESAARQYLRDPWEARNEYIGVILDRSQESRDKFLAAQASRQPNRDEQVTVWKLLELQRHAMLMYTSCGWFFDEISGIETVQVIQYASRAIQLAQEVLGRDLEPEFLNLLEKAPSNIPENRNGRQVYENFVRPARIDTLHAAAHFAISSVFQQYGQQTRIFSFSFESEHRDFLSAGKTRLIIGRVRVASEITLESGLFTFAILYLGEHNLTGGVRPFRSPEAYDEMVRDIRSAYESADFPETIRRMDRHFGQTAYSLKTLFKDEQRRILTEIMGTTREDLESRFRLIAERYTPLMRFLEGAGVPLPPELETVTDYVLHSDIRRVLASDPLNLDLLRNFIHEAQTRCPKVLDAEISFVVSKTMEDMILGVRDEPADVERIAILERLAELVMPLPLGLNLWKVQNTYWEMLQQIAPEVQQRADAGDESAQVWLTHFLGLGERLEFALKLPLPQASAQAVV